MTKSMCSILGLPKSRCRVTNDTPSPLFASFKIKLSFLPFLRSWNWLLHSQLQEGRRENVVEAARMGGYGWMLGDEGSGFHVGRETVRTLCLQDDINNLGEPSNHISQPEPKPTHDLRSLILSQFGLPPTSKASDIFRELYAPDPSAEHDQQPEGLPDHRLLERSHRPGPSRSCGIQSSLSSLRARGGRKIHSAPISNQSSSNLS